MGSITFRGLTGRSVIYTDETEITDVNVIDVLNKALILHNKNSMEIDYLYRYYKGEQPIIHRTKEIRPEINNIIVENRANEIVTFKVAYLVGAPIQYVNRGKEEVLEERATVSHFPTPWAKRTSPRLRFTLSTRAILSLYIRANSVSVVSWDVWYFISRTGEFVTAFIPIASTMRLKITR